MVLALLMKRNSKETDYMGWLLCTPRISGLVCICACALAQMPEKPDLEIIVLPVNRKTIFIVLLKIDHLQDVNMSFHPG